MKNKIRKEILFLLLTILYQIGFTIHFLFVTGGMVTYPEWEKVGKVLYYKDQQYQSGKLIAAAVLLIIFIETSIVLFGIYKRTYTAVFGAAIGILLFYGVILQSFYNKGTNLKKQMLFIITGYAMMCLYYWIVRIKLTDSQIKVLAAVLAVLIWFSAMSVLILRILGKSTNGAYGWISVAGISIQPGEFMKVLLILFSSCCMRVELKRNMVLSYAGLHLFAIMTLVISRDLGNASVLLANGLISAFFIFFDEHKKSFLLASTVMVGGGVFICSAMPYVRRRFEACFHALESGSGQQYKSLMAIVKSGVHGFGADGNVTEVTGIFASSTDLAGNTIFALFGIVAFLMVIGAFILLFANVYFSPELSPFHSMQAVLGITTIFTQSILHIGGGLNVIPLTGTNLPLVSSGGSNMLAMFMMIGGVLAGLTPEFSKKHNKNVETVSDVLADKIDCVKERMKNASGY